MKRLICILLLVCTLVTLYGCAKSNEQYLRIHIRANSNSEIDQNIKYKVKDIVVTYLTPLVKRCDSIESVKNVIEDNHDNITTIIDSYLYDNGFGYKSSVTINNEFFPTRTYDNLTLQADYYDAIIINLGEGKGNNWWCVVYPPLCFTGNNVVYKSKIVELINKYL
ncbi:MAG: stage II sporulation protein R [Clostridia bacterium]|nr:stage II sporulation protein R [Clostridia bacterium]